MWQRYTEHKVGVIFWGLNFQSRAESRMFDLYATKIGPLTIPKLELVECSPGDQQLFLRISTISLSGDPRYSGQTFWLALDTASNRPPLSHGEHGL